MAPTSPSNSLSFPQAIEETKSLMDQITANKLSEAEIEQKVSSILSSKTGGRGFFVAYLTSDSSLADDPSVGVISGLKSAIKISSELLVKNLAMSSAMAVIHHQNGDLDNIAGSKRVSQRTSNLIQRIDFPSINTKLEKLNDTIQNGAGEYQEFLERWGYNEEQKEAIQASISGLL